METKFVALMVLSSNPPRKNEHNEKLLVVGIFNTRKRAEAAIQILCDEYESAESLGFFSNVGSLRDRYGNNPIADRWEPSYGSVVEVEQDWSVGPPEPHADESQTMLLGQ